MNRVKQSRRNGQSAVDLNLVTNPLVRVAIYCRVSTVEQRNNQSVDSQRLKLERKIDSEEQQLVGVFIDDGVSGTVPLADRPEGGRLIEACRNGEVDVVIVYRLDRLARRLEILLDAHNVLDTYNVGLISSTESFDSRTSIGRFIFHLLGSLAELEHETIEERFSVGRERIASAHCDVHESSPFINGVLPFGYMVAEDRCLVPSDRMVPELGMTEAQLVKSIFARVLGEYDGVAQSATEITDWLRAANVPSYRRFYHSTRADGGTQRLEPNGWNRPRVCYLIHNEVYTGKRTIHANGAPYEQEVPALVSRPNWERANDVIAHNQGRGFGKKSAEQWVHILRGKITCGCLREDGKACNYTLVGTHGGRGKSRRGAIIPSDGRPKYYHCPAKRLEHSEYHGRSRCTMTMVRADQLETAVWADIRQAVENPGSVLEPIRTQLHLQQGGSPEANARREALRKRIGQLEQGRLEMKEGVRTGMFTMAEATEAARQTSEEQAALRQELDAMITSDDLTQSLEERLVTLAMTLAEAREGIEMIERDGNRVAMAKLINQLVASATATVNSAGEWEVRVRYAYERLHTVRQNEDTHLKANLLIDQMMVERTYTRAA